ncbi:zinc finger protein ZFP2-like [Eurosta solidaginis]|uniref:zinc finger protein ZFP2-like n=1 Tax=Eurosta solidaginis TaxID=178769 RepID=UPI0035306530
MEAEMDLLHFEFICRTCMHVVAEADGYAASNSLDLEQPKRQWQSIFETVADCDPLPINEMLNSTLQQINVQLSDELPKNICCKCVEHLLSAYRFQQMCIQSDQKMRELITNCNANLKIKASPIQAPIIDDTEGKKRFEVESMNDLRAQTGLQASVNDPLQNVDAATPLKEYCKSTQVDVNDYLKMELGVADFDHGSFADYNNYEVTAFTIDPKATSGRVTQPADEENTAKTDVPNSDGEHSDWKSDRNLKNRRLKKACRSKKTGGKTKKRSIVRKEQHVSKDSSVHNCTLCEKSFNSRRYLLKHLRRHKKWDELKNMDPKPESHAQHIRFKCDICGHYYNKPESLYEHRLTHEDSNKSNNPYICNICEKVYGSQRTLTRHKRQRHRTTEERAQETAKLYVCKFCNKSFQQSGTLKDHLRTHTGEQPYLCSECGKAFSSSSNMKQHLLRHGGVKRYECPDCPKKFPCLSDLASHKAVHRRHKPHICDICGSAFGKPYQLKKHKMYHNGDKPYKCEYCEMRFVCMDHQRRHMRTHTGEKPYKCNYCERAFAQSNDLIKHLRTHLGKNVYRCELCPSAFRLATELRVHFAVHKNEDAETLERNKKALMDEEVRLRSNVASKKVQLPVEQSLQTMEPDIKTVVLDE